MPFLRCLFFFTLSLPARWLNPKMINPVSEGLHDVLSRSRILRRHHIARNLWFECSLQGPNPSPSMWKKNTLLYVFIPVECVGNCLSPFVSMGAVCLHLQAYLAQGTFLSSETWDSQIPLEIMSFLPPACLYPERSTRGPEPWSVPHLLPLLTHQPHPEGEFWKTPNT